MIVDAIKAHPVLAAGTAATAIVLILMLRSSSPAVAPGTMGDTATGNAISDTMAQLASNIQMATIAAGASASHDAASLEAARLGYEAQNNANEIGAGVALAQINASLQALTTRDTLESQVAIGAQNAGVETTRITSNATTEQFHTLAQALTSQAQIQASTTQAAIAASKKDCGFFGKIFGC